MNVYTEYAYDARIRSYLELYGNYFHNRLVEMIETLMLIDAGCLDAPID